MSVSINNINVPIFKKNKQNKQNKQNKIPKPDVYFDSHEEMFYDPDPDIVEVPPPYVPPPTVIDIEPKDDVFYDPIDEDPDVTEVPAPYVPPPTVIEIDENENYRNTLKKEFVEEKDKLLDITKILGTKHKLTQETVNEAREILKNLEDNEINSFILAILDKFEESRRKVYEINTEMNNRTVPVQINQNQNQNNQELEQKIKEHEKTIDSLEKLIVPGSKEEELKKCLNKLRILKLRTGGSDPLEAEFNINDPKDLGRLLELDLLFSSILSMDADAEITYVNEQDKDVTFNLARELDKKDTDVNKVMDGIMNQVSMYGINMNRSEIEEEISTRIDENWITIGSKSFDIKNSNLIQEINLTTQSSKLSIKVNSEEGILELLRPFLKEIYDYVIPFIPKDSERVNRANKVGQISRYMYDIHEANPNVDMDKIFKFGKKIHDILLNFSPATLINPLIDPEKIKTEKMNVQVGEEENTFKPIIETQIKDVSFYRNPVEMNKFISMVTNLKDPGFIYSIMYTILRMKERALENKKSFNEWKFNFAGKFKEMSYRIVPGQHLGLSRNEIGEAEITNPYEINREEYIQHVKEVSLGSMKPPSKPVYLSYGKTRNNDFDYFELAKTYLKARNNPTRPGEQKEDTLPSPPTPPPLPPQTTKIPIDSPGPPIDSPGPPIDSPGPPIDLPAPGLNNKEFKKKLEKTLRPPPPPPGLPRPPPPPPGKKKRVVNGDSKSRIPSVVPELTLIEQINRLRKD